KRAALATIISVKPMMALSGVRSSWLMLATNSDLRWLASASLRLVFWVSSDSRTFSIAVTACSANVGTRPTWCAGNGPQAQPRQHERANRFSLAQQRNGEHGAKARSLLRLHPSVFRIGQNIGDLDNSALQQGPPHHRLPPCLDRDALQVIIGVGTYAIGGRVVIGVGVLLAHNCGHWRIAKSCRRLRQRIEHRLEIETRAANDLEYLGGGCLLLQRFALLIE